MAAPQQISLGIGSPANIGWFITFGLGDYGGAATVPVSYGDPRELRSRNVSFSSKAPTFRSRNAPFFPKSPQGGRH